MSTNTPVIRAKTTKEFEISRDSLTKLRLKNRQISSSVVSENMKDRKLYSFSSIDTIKANELNNSDFDWVTFGVIESVSPVRTSQKGNEYQMWKLTDLSENSISLFLYKHSFEAFKHARVGQIYILVNPFIQVSQYKSGEVSLSIDCSANVLYLGDSIDYAVCQATCKNGQKCTNVINGSLGKYCVYHMNYKMQQVGVSRREVSNTPILIFKDKNPTPYLPSMPLSSLTSTMRTKAMSSTVQSLAPRAKLAPNSKLLPTPSQPSQKENVPQNQLFTNKKQGVRYLTSLKQLHSKAPLRPVIGRDALPGTVIDLDEEEERLKKNAELAAYLKSMNILPSAGQKMRSVSAKEYLMNPHCPKRVPLEPEPTKKRLLNDSLLPAEEQKAVSRTPITTKTRSSISPVNITEPLKQFNKDPTRGSVYDDAKPCSAQTAQLYQKINDVEKKPFAESNKELTAEDVLNIHSSYEKECAIEQYHQRMEVYAKLDKMQELKEQIMEMEVVVSYCNNCKKFVEKNQEYCFQHGHFVCEKKIMKRMFECLYCEQRRAFYGTKEPRKPCLCGKCVWKQISLFEPKKQEEKKPSGLIQPMYTHRATYVMREENSEEE